MQARRRFLRLRTAAVALQAAWRARRARWRFARMRQSAAVLQRAWRLRQAARRLRRHQAAVEIQRRFRGASVRAQLQRMAQVSINNNAPRSAGGAE